VVCVFFLGRHELCAFWCGLNCVFFVLGAPEKHKKTHKKKKKSAFLEKWNSGRLTSTAFGPAAQQSLTPFSFSNFLSKRISERECEKMELSSNEV
jgi:hypothetical protein